MIRGEVLLWAALMAVLGLSPAPAAGQLGGLKGKIKSQIIKQATGGTPTDSAQPSAAQGPAPSPQGAGGGRGGRGGRAAAKAGRMGAGGAPGAGPGGVVYNDYVLEITPAVLSRLQAGLAAWKGQQAQVVKQLAKLPTKEQWESCARAAIGTPEGQKLVQSMTAGMNAARTDQERIAVTQQASQQQLALYRAKCGPNPREMEAQRLAIQRLPLDSLLGASRFTEVQFSVLKERIIPFCTLAGSAGTDASGQTRVPGSGMNIFYVYSPAEVQALQGQCAALLPTLKATG